MGEISGEQVSPPDVGQHQTLTQIGSNLDADAQLEEYTPSGKEAMDKLTGKPAVPFELRDSGGRIHVLSDYGGSWLLLVFHRHLG